MGGPRSRRRLRLPQPFPLPPPRAVPQRPCARARARAPVRPSRAPARLRARSEPEGGRWRSRPLPARTEPQLPGGGRGAGQGDAAERGWAERASPPIGAGDVSALASVRGARRRGRGRGRGLGRAALRCAAPRAVGPSLRQPPRPGSPQRPAEAEAASSAVRHNSLRAAGPREVLCREQRWRGRLEARRPSVPGLGLSLVSWREGSGGVWAAGAEPGGCPGPGASRRRGAESCSSAVPPAGRRRPGSRLGPASFASRVGRRTPVGTAREFGPEQWGSKPPPLL